MAFLAATTGVLVLLIATRTIRTTVRTAGTGGTAGQSGSVRKRKRRARATKATGATTNTKRASTRAATIKRVATRGPGSHRAAKGTVAVARRLPRTRTPATATTKVLVRTQAGQTGAGNEAGKTTPPTRWLLLLLLLLLDLLLLLMLLHQWRRQVSGSGVEDSY